MNSCELVMLISSIACSISQCYPPEELAILAAALTQLGDTLETMLVNDELCKKDK